MCLFRRRKKEIPAMTDKYFYEVMFDDNAVDVSKEAGLV